MSTLAGIAVSIQLRPDRPNPWHQALEQALTMLSVARAEIVALRAALAAHEARQP